MEFNIPNTPFSKQTEPSNIYKSTFHFFLNLINCEYFISSFFLAIWSKFKGCEVCNILSYIVILSEEFTMRLTPSFQHSAVLNACCAESCRS